MGDLRMSQRCLDGRFLVQSSGIVRKHGSWRDGLLRRRHARLRREDEPDGREDERC
jgi:hypothetical protein